MREQRGDAPRLAVGGKAEPPALVGAREVHLADAGAAPAGAQARERAFELLGDLGAARDALQQPRERLGLFLAERQAPDALERIPAAPGDRAQELAHPLVVGEAQDGLAAVEPG